MATIFPHLYKKSISNHDITHRLQQMMWVQYNILIQHDGMNMILQIYQMINIDITKNKKIFQFIHPYSYYSECTFETFTINVEQATEYMDYVSR